MKDVHELWQFTIVKLASCTTRLDSLEHNMQTYRTKATQTSIDLEALEDRVAAMEGFLANTELQD